MAAQIPSLAAGEAMSLIAGFFQPHLGAQMNPWFCTNLGDAMLAGEALGPIQELFWAEYQTAACPADMAIFQRHESEGRLHCELKLFFSPATAAVAQACAATACQARAGRLGLAGRTGTGLVAVVSGPLTGFPPPHPPAQPPIPAPGVQVLAKLVASSPYTGGCAQPLPNDAAIRNSRLLSRTWQCLLRLSLPLTRTARWQLFLPNGRWKHHA